MAAYWAVAGSNDLERRIILASQIAKLRLRRGVVGRRFDEERILLEWNVVSNGSDEVHP
ncbi:hypothetical protein [Glutamicibacter arilaitensis]|uniref:hypothetical protein n=1 Tax=Glutamicibacter arilaitensis TaxID=256701 RepID=UPI00384E4E82